MGPWKAEPSKSVGSWIRRQYHLLWNRLSPPQMLALGFLIMICIGTILLSFPQMTAGGERLNLVDALFTATSAVCVTGLIVKDTATHFSPLGQAVILVLIQMGGLGLMTMTTMFALLLGRRLTLKGKIVTQEALGYFTLRGTVELVTVVVVTTLVIEAVGAFLLFGRFLVYGYDWSRALGHSVFHAVSAFCNAGFSLNSDSFMQFSGDLWVNLVLICLIVIGGLGFLVVNEILHKKGKRRLSLHARVVILTSLVLLVVGSIIIFVLEYDNPGTLAGMPLGKKVVAASFQSVTARTAGFHTINTRLLGASAALAVVLLMFVGASPMSTGGGVKTTTLAILAAAIWSTFKGGEDVEVSERRIPLFLVIEALCIVVIALSLVTGVTLFLLAIEPFRPLDILFEVVSAFGTVGLSRGITPHLSKIARVLLSFTMFAGRIGPFTLFLALSARQKRVAAGRPRYPEEKVIMG